MNALLARKKSPRAPSMALDEAIDRVQKVYDRERLNPAPTDVVAQHLGYKGAANGAALSALASVRYFGLADRPREGYLAVTKDFEHFKYAPDEQQRRSQLIGFLRKPPLYAELLDKYDQGLPSEANLRFELIQRGFSPLSAEATLIAFKRSVDYTGYFTGDNRGIAVPIPTGDHGNTVDVPPDDHKPEPAGRVGINSIDSPHTTPNFGSDDEMDRIPVRLPGGRRAWLIIPASFFNADKARLKAQIDLLLAQDEEEVP